jgi:hypothetical protein
MLAELKTYLNRLDRHRLDECIPEYRESPDEELKELDDLWHAMSAEDRAQSGYLLHCSQYLNPVEYAILTDKQRNNLDLEP